MIQQVLINSLITGSTYSLIAVGFAIIYRTVKFFHFAHGVVYASAAYLAYTALVLLRLNPVLAVFLTLIFACFLGIGMEISVYRSLRQNGSPDLVFLLASFGIFLFLQNLLQLTFGTQVLTLRSGTVREGHQILGAIITNTQLYIILAALALVSLSWILVQRSRLGKAIRAVSDDIIAANVVGINPERIILISFAIGSTLAGAAGILISLETNIEPTMGMDAILKGIIASIVGGSGSVPGALVGGVLLGLAENFGIWQIPSGWKDAIAFTILILFLLFRPYGIMRTHAEKDHL